MPEYQTTASDASPLGSELFTVRLWKENVSQGESEWRGQLRNVATGETGYFRDWSTLIEHFQRMLLTTGDHA